MNGGAVKRIITGLQAKHHQNEQKNFQVLFIVFARSLLTIFRCLNMRTHKAKLKNENDASSLTHFTSLRSNVLHRPLLFDVNVFSFSLLFLFHILTIEKRIYIYLY